MNIVTHNEHLAKYVLQVNIMHRGNKRINTMGSFNIWKKGGMFGVADDLMRFCPKGGCVGTFDFGFFLTEEEVERIGDEEYISRWPDDIKIRHDNWHLELVRCPKCQLQSPRFALADSYGFNMTQDLIADRMVEIFAELGRNADLYKVNTKEDLLIHKANYELRETAKPDFDKYAGLLEQARDRDQIFYSLASIIKDTHSGNLKARFKAFLRS